MAATSALQARTNTLCSSSFTGSVQSLRRTALPVRAVAPRATICSAQSNDFASKAGKALAAAVFAGALTLGTVDAAKADIAGLTPCAQSKGFQKREKNEIKGLNKRLKQYEDGSAPALALKATIERTEKRFANYAKSGLLCGTDGLPHLISDPGLALRFGHAGEVFIPTIGFLYIAGWIGYVGRQYIIKVKGEKKPTDKEIIIDVPLAIRLAWQGAGWPLRTIQELRAGTLTEKDANITVSPR